MKYEIDSKNKDYDLQEIKNYFEALNMGKSLLVRLPISTRLFKKLQKKSEKPNTLVVGVSGS